MKDIRSVAEPTCSRTPLFSLGRSLPRRVFNIAFGAALSTGCAEKAPLHLGYLEQIRAGTKHAPSQPDSPSALARADGTGTATTAEAEQAPDDGGATWLGIRFPPPLFVPDEHLYACWRRVRNSPAIAEDGRIPAYRPYVRVRRGVTLALAPQNGACLTSGFGRRWGRLHKGLDYSSHPPVMIFAAASGTVVEATYRHDYGNMVLIDHGRNVYTRYGHLADFEPDVRPGAKVRFGEALGVMGDTSDRHVGLHLHYEILVGDYHTPKKSFGLKALNPFRLVRTSRPPSRRLARR